MEKMSPERIFEFVNDGARTAVIAWVGSDGHPHVTPIWITTYGVPGDFTVLFTTGAETPKGKALRHDLTSLVVDNQTAPFSFVKINGVVELIDDVPTVRRWATVLGGRYMGAIGPRSSVRATACQENCSCGSRRRRSLLSTEKLTDSMIAAATRAERTPPTRDVWIGRFVWLSLAIGCLPILSAVYHGLVDHWYPIGDNGYFVIRARDVLTRHHPLLGAWSSGSNSLAESVNNLGPLQLDLLAPFAKAGVAAGTVIGVGAVQLVSVVGIWATLRRLTNAAVVIVAMVMVTTIGWSMGTGLLLETRQHPYLVLPFLCLLVLVWAVASGALWALPWAAFVASLVVQTHLSYLFFFTGLSLWALAALGVICGRAVATTPANGPLSGREHGAAPSSHWP